MPWRKLELADELFRAPAGDDNGPRNVRLKPPRDYPELGGPRWHGRELGHEGAEQDQMSWLCVSLRWAIPNMLNNEQHHG